MQNNRHLTSIIKLLNYALLGSALLSLLAVIWMSMHDNFDFSGWRLAVTVLIICLALGMTGVFIGFYLEFKLIKTRWRIGGAPLLAGTIIIYLISAWQSLVNNAYVRLPGFTTFSIVVLILALTTTVVRIVIELMDLYAMAKKPPLIIDHATTETNKIIVTKVSFSETFKRKWDETFANFTLGSWKYYLLFLAVMGMGYFAIALVNNQFTVPLGGDYTQQTIPFYTNGYDDWWHFIKTGEFPLWDSSTNLGVNNIGSNAFYYALNPFFLPILLVPRPLIAQGIALLMIGKLILAAVAMKAYLEYMGVSKQTALFFAFAYAFCGWNTYYLWFNHFMEVTVVFPLIFLGIEKVLKEKRPWVLAGALALMGFTNYFFLVTSCFVGVLYAGFRFFQKIKDFRRWDYLLVPVIGIVAFAAGIFMSTIVLLPGVMTSMQANRVTDATYLDNLKLALNDKNWKMFFDYVLTWEAQSPSYTYKKLYPLATFFFPVVSDRSSPIFATSSYDNTISSLFLYTPVMVMLIPSFFRSYKNRKISHFLVLFFLLFAIFTPFFYQALHAFTQEYGRWQIFVTLILITYTALNFDHKDEMPIWQFDVSVAVLIIGAFLTYKAAFPYQSGPRFGPLLEREYIVFYEFIALLIVYLIYRLGKSSPHLLKYVLFFTAFEALLMGNLTMVGHGTVSFQNSVGGGISKVNEETQAVENINKNDDSFFRVFSSSAYKGNDNIGMRENFNGLGAFHSLYNFNLKDFNAFSHVNYNHQGWSMGIQEKRYNLDTFLGLKYYIIDRSENKIRYVNAQGQITNEIVAPYYNVPLGYDYMESLSTERYAVYKNTRYLDLGSSYDTLMAHNRYYGEDPEAPAVSRFYRNYADEPIVNEEKYLRYGILDEHDLQEVQAAYPELAAAEYQYSLLDQTIIDTSALNQTKYYCGNGFPYDRVAEIDTISGCAITTDSRYVRMKTGLILTRKNGTNIATSAAHLAIKLRTTDNARIFLLDEADNIITFDDHNNLGSSYKFMRGFYSPLAVKSVVIVPVEDLAYLSNTVNIYVQPETKMIEQHTRLVTNGFNNVVSSYNQHTFTTNYSATRFAVINMPYDEGWSVKIKLDGTTELAPKVYRAQGGFVGFVIPEGETEISLKYFTPYLGESLVIGGTTFVLWLGSFLFVYFWYDRRQKNKKSRQNPAQMSKEL